MSASTPTQLSGIDVGEIVDEYHSRGLDSWSDAQLIAAVAGVVSEPRRDPADSFVLHAPLELAARAALLPLVAPGCRERARLHIVAIAAQFDTYDPVRPVAGSAKALPGPADPIVWLDEAIRAGDLDEADRAAAVVASALTSADLVSAVAPLVTPLTAAAAHAPIFLHHLLRRDVIGGLHPMLLRPLARELARNPEWRIAWIDGWDARSPTDERALGDALAAIAPMGVPGSTFIHPLLMQIDRSGVAAEQLGPVIGTYNVAAANEVLRIAARSMLTDTTDHAPYGWTHCLTLPQGILGVTRGTAQADLGLAIAATHVAAFRAGLGTTTLDRSDPAGLPTVDASALATTAATSHDAHIVKFVLACLDAGNDDPAARPLYLAAGQHLLDVWADQGGDPTDPLP